MSRLVLSPVTSLPNTPQNAAMGSGSTTTNQSNLPSPTLTNPDMILPYDDERESSTPSPPFDAVRRLHEDITQSRFHPVSPPQQYQLHNQQEDDPYHEHSHSTFNATTNNLPSENIGVAVSLTQETQANSPHAIWYDQYDHHDLAPPLSDIGEEEEDDDGRASRAHRVSQDTVRLHDASDQRNSTAIPNAQWASDDLESCDADSCSASSSTISASGEMGKTWPHDIEDRDPDRDRTQNPETTDSKEDNGVKDGPGFDDDYVERSSFESERNRMSAIVEEEEGGSDDDIKQAEKILANAKKRLTHMEGNLTRARSSMRMTPSPSPSSSYSPTPSSQPFAGFSKSLLKGERRAQTSLAGALLRQRAWQEMNAHQPSHTRRLSEIYVPSFHSTRQTSDRQPVRSASALASTNPSGLGMGNASPKNGYFGPRHANRASGGLYNYAPSSPTPDAISQPNSPSMLQSSSSDNVGSGNAGREPKLSSMEEFNAAYPSSPPSRAHSQLQVRELQGQMHDLQSKVSTLNVRARGDSLRRRSLQSLRAPSPFTAAEQWYASALHYGEDGLKRESIVVKGGWDAQLEETGNSGENPNTTRTSPFPGKSEEVHGDATPNSPRPQSKAESEDYFEDAVDHEGSDWSSGSEIDRDALEEILNEPLDSPVLIDQDLLEEFPSVPPIPEALRHEDRVDAFDYEHFYLHSVLGNYSGGAPRRDSSSSNGSIETTRPTSAGETYHSATREKNHRRTNSADSVSTAATFATATEGEYSSEDEDRINEVIDEALLWDRESATPTPTGNDEEFRQRQFSGEQNGVPEPRSTPSRHRPAMSNGHSIDSPTYPGFNLESTSSTPRASQNHSRHSRHHSQAAANMALSTPDLISSLISISSPSKPFRQRSPSSSSLSNEDITLLEPLLQNLGRVCSDLYPPSSSPMPTDQNHAMRLRRRLEIATRVLDGELDS